MIIEGLKGLKNVKIKQYNLSDYRFFLESGLLQRLYNAGIFTKAIVKSNG